MYRIVEVIDISEKIQSLTSFIFNKIKSREYLISFFRSLGIKIDKPLQTFESIYAFSLADSHNFPKEVLDFLRRSETKQRFRNAYDNQSTNNALKDILDSLDETSITYASQIEMDVEQVLPTFISLFNKNIESAMDFIQKTQNNKLTELHEILKSNLMDKPNANENLNNYYKLINPLTSPSLPENFVERETIEVEIKKQIINSVHKHTRTKRFSITGFSGVGKSTLVMSISKDFEISKCFSNILTLPFSEINQIDPNLLLHDLLYALEGKYTEYTNKEQIALQIKEILQEQKILIILDDVDNSEQIEDIMACAGDNTVILLTTREKDLPLRFGITNNHELKGFSDSEAIKFVNSFFQRDFSAEEFKVNILPVNKLIDGNPLALRIICSSILLNEYDWKEIIRDLSSSLLKNRLEFTNPKDKSQSVDLSIDLSIKKLKPFERKFLGFMGVFPRGVQIFYEDVAMLLSAVYEDKPKEHLDFDWMSKTRDYAKKLINVYYKKGLIDCDPKLDPPTVRIHSLVHDNSIRYLQKNKLLELAIIYHLNIYFGLLISDIPNSDYSLLPFFFPQIEIIFSRILNRLINNDRPSIPKNFIPLVLPEIVNKLGKFLTSNGQYQRVIYWYQQLLFLPKHSISTNIRRVAVSELTHSALQTYDLKKAEMALNYFESNYLFRSSKKDKFEFSINKINLLQAQKKYSECLQLLDSINIEKINEDERGRVFALYSKIYIEKGEAEKAKEYIDNSIAIAQASKDQINLSHRYGDMCLYYLTRSEPDLSFARHFACKSLDIAYKQKEISTILNRYQNLLSVSIHEKDFFQTKFFLECYRKIVVFTQKSKISPITEETEQHIDQMFEKLSFSDLAPNIFEFVFFYITSGLPFEFDIFINLLSSIKKDVFEEEVTNNLLSLFHNEINPEKIVHSVIFPYNLNFCLLLLSLHFINFSVPINLILDQIGKYLYLQDKPNFNVAIKILKEIPITNQEEYFLREDLLYLCDEENKVNELSKGDIDGKIKTQLIADFLSFNFDAIDKQKTVQKKKNHNKSHKRH